ncbi:MAG: pentapeptide repeat-containing protein, partial [Methylocella sp.]
MSKRLREWRLSRARAARAEKPAAPPDPAQKFAGQAHDLDALRKTVEDAAAVSAGFWLSYLFVLLYIAIAAGAVTHKDLLLENPVKLPFLSDLPLPLVAFFFLAPIVFIVSHAYTLVHFVMLGAKVGVYDAELRAQLGDAPETREGLRRQLPSNIFVQFLAGPRDIRNGGLGWLLKAIAWISLVIGPVLLLLLIQAQFLPYHLEWVTWVQRFAVLADVILLWLLWPAVLNRRSRLMWRLERRRKGWPGVLALTVRYIAGLTACLIALGLAFTAATFPGERMDEWIGKVQTIPPNPVTAWLGHRSLLSGEPLWTSFHDLLFNGNIYRITRRRNSLFSNTLVLPGFDALEAAKIDDAKKLDSLKQTLVLRGRHLESAVFDGADLRKADLEGAQLQGASLSRVQLQRASLDQAQLQGASLHLAQLQDASLDNAQFQRASLDYAQLQRASLSGARLQDASLDFAQLQGALLNGAQLQGASLREAQLQGVSFNGARLQGASLESAQLQGASLVDAELQGASLIAARLQGARLVAAKLQG